MRTTKPMMLKIGALVGRQLRLIFVLSYGVRGSRDSLSSSGTYIEPTLKTAMTPSFFVGFIFRFHTDLIGTNRMSTSLMVLKRPLVLRRLGISMHLPLMDLSHMRALGLHSQILTMVRAR